MTWSLELVFKHRAVEPVEIWCKLLRNNPTVFSYNDIFELYDSRMKVSGIEKAILNRGKPHFNLKSKKASFRYSSVVNNDLSFLTIDQCISTLDDAYIWLKPFLAHESFIQSRVYEKDYEYWQNASDPLEYESVDRPFDHLPMKSNNLPFPLEQKVIDTTNNPGRRILCQKYIEAIGSYMWFSDLFWEVSGTRKESVLNQNWLNCQFEKEVPDVLFVKAMDSPFTSGEGNEGELQRKIRSLLFQE